MISELDVRPGGDDFVVVSVADTAGAQAVAKAFRATGRWLEAVAGIEDVVLRFDNATMDMTAALQFARDSELKSGSENLRGQFFEVPVCYAPGYGPDLAAVCEQLKLSTEDFVRKHTGCDHKVDMMGFTPGFAYLAEHRDFDVPRRDEPRIRVEQGSIGLAGGRTGIYALAGPGGWQIVGRTPMSLFEPASDRPFVLEPGDSVRFVAISREEFDEYEAT